MPTPNINLLENRLLTTHETASILRISRLTLMQWRTIDNHPLRYIKWGNSVRYLEQTVSEFLENHMVDNDGGECEPQPTPEDHTPEQCVTTNGFVI